MCSLPYKKRGVAILVRPEGPIFDGEDGRRSPSITPPLVDNRNQRFISLFSAVGPRRNQPDFLWGSDSHDNDDNIWAKRASSG